MITILAVANDYPRIRPLLGSLVYYKPQTKFELIVVDLLNYSETIKKQLNEFRSSFKWSLYKEGRDFNLFDLVQDEVLSLPASCIPYKDSINKLITEPSFSRCKLPGSLLSFSTNSYSNNVNKEMLNDCMECDDKVWFGTKGFILDHDAGIIKYNKDCDFIILSAGKTIYGNMHIDLVEKNH